MVSDVAGSAPPAALDAAAVDANVTLTSGRLERPSVAPTASHWGEAAGEASGP